METEMKLFFGGLWAPVQKQKRQIRPAMLFLGDCYFVRFELDPTEKTLAILSNTYVIEDDEVFYSSLHPEENGDEILSFRWRLVGHRLLELEENGRISVWEPVRAEEMAEEGYPIALFEKYRKAYADQGFFYTIEGLVPDSSAAENLKRLKSKK